MEIKSDDYWTITGDATPDSISIVVQDENDPEESFSWEFSVDCAYELIESLMVMVMGWELFDLIEKQRPEDNPNAKADIPVFYVEWLKNNKSFLQKEI